MTISSRPTLQSIAAIRAGRCSICMDRSSASIPPSFRRPGGSIGIGFAIPAELASGVIAQLRQFGETRRGWLGVRIQPVTDDIAESLGMTSSKGALVAGIIDGGPVANGSILRG